MKNLVNFNANSDKSENLHTDVLILLNLYYDSAKKYRGVMWHNTEIWCKILGGTELCFQKSHEKFGKFWPNTQKSQNLHFNAGP